MARLDARQSTAAMPEASPPSTPPQNEKMRATSPLHSPVTSRVSPTSCIATKAKPTKRPSPAPTQAPANIHPRMAKTALPRARTSMVKVSTDRRVWMSSVGSAMARHYEAVGRSGARGSTALVQWAERVRGRERHSRRSAPAPRLVRRPPSYASAVVRLVLVRTKGHAARLVSALRHAVDDTHGLLNERFE